MASTLQETPYGNISILQEALEKAKTRPKYKLGGPKLAKARNIMRKYQANIPQILENKKLRVEHKAKLEEQAKKSSKRKEAS